VEELYSLHRKIDYYSILGTQPNDTEEMIKKAFFNAEMRYHSDMYPLIGEDLKNKLDEIFTYMKTAYQTLTDPKRRRQYDLGMEGISGKNAPDRNIEAGIRPEENDIHLSKAPKDSPSPWKVLADNSEKAKLTFRDGMVAFWDKDDRKAAELFEMATDLDCSMPEYPYMYGRVLGSLGRNKEALQALNRANELKPLDPDILVEMGHIYLSLGFPARAASYLNQAIKIEPSNKRAQDGLRKTSRKKAGGR
jgi:curved DNA-binding protein CbpA